MKLIRSTYKSIIILVALICISFSGLVSADPITISGLFNSGTNSWATCNVNVYPDCVLNGTDYNIVNDRIVPTQGINLIINQQTNFNVSCVSDDSNCFNLPDSNKINIEFSGFNSIKVYSKTTIRIDDADLIDTQIDFKSDLILQSRLDINISKEVDCLSEQYDQNKLYSYVPKSHISFDRVEIKPYGVLNIINNKDYFGYNKKCGGSSLYNLINKEEEESTGGDSTPTEGGNNTEGENDTSEQSSNLNLYYFADIISFEQVDNNGQINLNCSTKVDNELYNDNACNFYFKSIAGKLPNQISNANNRGNLYVSTCGPLYLPGQNIDYNVCYLNYVRPEESEENITDLNKNNVRVRNINKVKKICSVGNIEEQISRYLFTSDSNIVSTPVIFGTINYIIDSKPLEYISINTSDSTVGLYNTRNLSASISQISKKGNSFFKLFLNPNLNKDTNLLDSYLFRFKLDANADIALPEIKLDYPFKIHK